MRLFHICTKREFEKDGEKKARWYRAGTLKVADSGVQYIRFFHLPMVDFFVFSAKGGSASCGEDKPPEEKPLPVIE